jgi:hypothetical protein
MSTEVENVLAEASLSLLAGLECEFDGGPIGPDGHCSEECHAHCPFCGNALDCPHEIASWDDSFGYRGPEFPIPPESDDAICKQQSERVRELFGDLGPVWDAYLEHRDESTESAGSELLRAVTEILDLPIVTVEWEQTQSMASGFGARSFALDPDAVLPELILASARIQAVFDRFQPPAAIDDEQADQDVAR